MCWFLKNKLLDCFPGYFYYFTFLPAIIQFLCICYGHYIYLILAILIRYNSSTLRFSFACSYWLMLSNIFSYAYLQFYLVNYLFMPLAKFYLDCLFFLLLNFQRFLCVLAISLLWDKRFENIFSQLKFVFSSV